MAGEYSPAMHVHAGNHVYSNTRMSTFPAASTTAKLTGALCKALPRTSFDVLKIDRGGGPFDTICIHV